MAATESNRRSASLKIPALPFRGVAQKYPITAIHAKIHAKVFCQLNLWQTYGYNLLFDFKE